MNRQTGMALVALAAIGLAATALAAEAPPARLRGTIESVTGNGLVLKTYSGKTIELTLNSGTKYAWLVPAQLADIKPGVFVGITATGPDSKMVAAEVHLFPDSMRGTGEGHYPWSLPAVVANADAGQGLPPTSTTASGAPLVQGTMTNGTVAGATNATANASGGPPVQGTMTNGTVAANTGEAAGKELTITYNNGQKAEILVPAKVPVVLFVPADISALTPGAKSFILASPEASSHGFTADLVLVGKNGLLPPM